MAQAVEIPISGQATANVKVNLRQGAPSVQAPVLRKLNAQTSIAVQAIVVGDNVQGNPLWYRTSDNAYAWAGAFAPLQSAAAAKPPAQKPPTYSKPQATKIVTDAFNALNKPGVTPSDTLGSPPISFNSSGYTGLYVQINNAINDIQNEFVQDIINTWSDKTTVASIIKQVMYAPTGISS